MRPSRHFRLLWLHGAGKPYPWPVLSAKADLLVITGRMDHAIATYRASLPLLEACGDRHAQGQCLSDFGFALMLQGDFGQAERLGACALAIGRETCDEPIMAKALNLLGNIANTLGHFNDSVGHYQSALELGCLGGPGVDRCSLLKNIGVAYYELGDYPRAVACQQQALTLAEAAGQLLEIGAIHLNFGIIRQRQHDLAGALEFFRRALSTFAQIGHKDLARKVHNYLGIVHSDLGQLSLALTHYGESLALARDMGDQSGLATVLNNLGNIYLNRGDYPQAARDFGECLRLFKDMGHEEGEAIASANLGEVLKELGEYPESDRLYSRAIGYGRKQQARYYLCHFLAGYADLKLRQGHDDQSLALAGEGLRLAQQLTVPDISFSCRLLQARLRAKRDLPAALSQLRRLRDACREDEPRAQAAYWLFTHGRLEADRLATLEVLRRLDTDPENLALKQMIQELEMAER